MGEYFLVQYRTADDTARLALQTDAGTFALNGHMGDLAHLMRNVPAAGLLDALQSAQGEPLTAKPEPFNVPERVPVWAGGVTYKISEEARERESNNSNIYRRVYDAERPELFSKAIGEQVVPSEQPVGIRYDASWSVPEPELTVVFNAALEVIGFTIGNDMSSRDIEGANPLYLPQAKTYERSCAVGSRIWLTPAVQTWLPAEIRINIERDGASVFSGNTSTAQIHRSLAELRDFLGRCQRFPHGVLLMTGTGVVPPDDFTLIAGDVVRIAIDPIGELVNPVEVVQVQR